MDEGASLQHYLEFAETMARKAGKLMREGQRGGFAIVYEKHDGSDVTQVDKQINRLVIEEVTVRYPDHGVYGEEESRGRSGARLTWVCDPVDGTIMYAHKIPTSVFSLALVQDGKPIVAVVNDPWSGKLYSAIQGGGTTCNGEKIMVSKYSKLFKAMIGFEFWSGVAEDFTSVGYVLAEAGGYLIDLGSVAQLGVLVAAGSVDALFFPGRHAHDVAAIKLLVEEAGGRVTDLAGLDQRYDDRINGCLVTNGALHDSCVNILRQHLGTPWQKYASS